MFTLDGGAYLPTVYARGPWSLESLHGGPVSALLAHHAEACDTEGTLRLARITTDLFRAVPFAPLHVDTEVVRRGRRILAVRASLVCEGVEVSRAQVLLLRPKDVDSSAGDLSREPIPFAADAAESTMMGGLEGEPAYSRTVRFRYLVGRGADEPAVAWIRVPLDLLPDVPLSPAARAAATADYVSPLSLMRRSGARGVPFINADVTLYLHRPPDGDWLCLQTTGRASHEGIATGEGVLHDRSGPVGRCLAVALAQSAPPGAMRARFIQGGIVRESSAGGGEHE